MGPIPSPCTGLRSKTFRTWLLPYGVVGFVFHVKDVAENIAVPSSPTANPPTLSALPQRLSLILGASGRGEAGLKRPCQGPFGC